MADKRNKKPYGDTVSTLLEAKCGLSWANLAVSLGYAPSYAATLNRVARRVPGAMSRAAENDLRQRLGLPPRTRRRYFRPCLPVELRGAYEQWRSEQC